MTGNIIVSRTDLAHAAFPIRRRLQAEPDTMGSTWERRISFGPKSVKTKPQGANGRKWSVGGKKVVLRGYRGRAGVALSYVSIQSDFQDQTEKTSKWPQLQAGRSGLQELPNTAESPNGARAPWSSVLQKKLNPHKFISKNYEKIIVVENTMIHQCENFQTQTLYILICVKKRNLGRFQIFEIAHCSSIQICTFLFLPRTEYKEFLIENFHSGGS